jgi:hypothetical protein
LYVQTYTIKKLVSCDVDLDDRVPISFVADDGSLV